MPSLSMVRDIVAPLDAVWDVFTDLEHAARNLSAVEKVEVLSDGPFGEGTRWLETRKMYGKSVTEEMWVSEIEPHKTYLVKAGAGATHYESRYEFAALDDVNTRVRFTFAGESTGFAKVVGSVMWPLLRGKMAKELGRDLKDLAAILERR